MNAGILLGQIDQQMIIVILGPQSAGYYTNYLSLFNLYGIFVFPFTALLFPIVTELVSKKQDTKVSILLSILYKYFTVFGLLM
jgi:O-antigen/teichoic acid export membrane protein